MPPRISVITPSYNQGEFLEETILSVHGQNYPNFEHIVIDGDSKDNSIEIIQHHKEKFSYWISEPDKGQADAINKGIAKSSGEILIWINSDDLLEPNALSKAANCFEKNPSAIMIHGKSILFGNGTKNKIIGEIQNEMKFRYLAYIPFPQPSSFFRRSLLESSGVLDSSLTYGMDYELVVRAALNGEIIFCDEILSRYRLHPKSKTNQSLEFAIEWNKVFSKLLRSLPTSTTLIQALTDCGFYQEGNDSFTIKRTYTSEDLKKVTLYHLLIQLHYHYNASKTKEVTQLCKLIRDLSPDFYEKNNLSSIYWKNKFINPGVIDFFRKFTRD